MTTSIPKATRRQILRGVAIGIGALSSGATAFSQSPHGTMNQVPGTDANQTRTFLHQDIDLNASAQRIYEILLSSKLFESFSGLPAEINPNVGGAFSMFAGQIMGRNVELIPNQRIVQAWRPAHWEPGVYSMVRFDLNTRGSETKVVLHHTGFPEGDFDHLDSGWYSHYWEPLKKFLV